MNVIEAEQVHQALNFPELIDAMDKAFAKEFTMPKRQVFNLDSSDSSHDAFALLPAWNDEVIAVKAFTYFPGNAEAGYQSLYSKIMLFNRKHGVPLALVDGASTTFWRTAAVSALASRYLSRQNSETLFMLGTGNLAPYMIRAHLSVRPIKQVIIWGRSTEKAQSIADELSHELTDIQFSVIDDIQGACAKADVICCATGSPKPLILGEWIKPGTHCDLIGNHLPTARECDTALITQSDVFVDSRDNTFNEAGELLMPVSEGAFSLDQVRGELSDLCSGQTPGREKDTAVTVFKSVGTALSDLVASSLLYRKLAAST